MTYLKELQPCLIIYCKWTKICGMRWNSKMSHNASIQPNFLLLSLRLKVTYLKFKECLKRIYLFNILKTLKWLKKLKLKAKILYLIFIHRVCNISLLWIIPSSNTCHFILWNIRIWYVYVVKSFWTPY